MSHSDTVRHLLKLFETFNVADVLQLFDKNAPYQFANYPPAVGLDQIRQAASSSHMDLIKSVTFDVRDMIELGDDVIVCEMEVSYGTTDGRTITLPCADLFRFNAQGQIQDMKIFIDTTPLSPSQAAAS